MNATTGLSPADMEILAFEAQGLTGGRKDTAICERFNLSPVVYYGRLNRIIDTPAALAYDAELVHRLQRIRKARADYREGRR